MVAPLVVASLAQMPVPVVRAAWLAVVSSVRSSGYSWL
jgi:hypothetical protein